MLRNGEVVQVGAPLELYDRPASTFVAGFIGSPSMNLIPGRLKFDGAPRIGTDDGGSLPLPEAPRGLAGQPVLYGQRPEHLALGSGGGLPAEVLVVEPTGCETRIALRSAGREWRVGSHERVTARPGDRLSLLPQAAHAHVSDAGSEARSTEESP